MYATETPLPRARTNGVILTNVSVSDGDPQNDAASDSGSDVRKSVWELLDSLVDYGYSFEVRGDHLHVEPTPDDLINDELQNAGRTALYH
jgi:hypothetical protein